MATRRVLVLDNDSAFLDLLQSLLGAYGFEVQVADPRPENISTVKGLNPEAVFIAVDAPDKVGYTLCSKVRKTVGKKIPIILATATLSPRDLSLHGKLKLHADIYLDKRSLSRDELLDKLDGLIGLEARTGPLPPEDDKDLRPSNDVEQILVGEYESDLLEEALAEVDEVTNQADEEGFTSSEPDSLLDLIQIPLDEDESDLLEETLAKVDEATDQADEEEFIGSEPDSLLDLIEETIESEGDANAVSAQTDVMDDHAVDGEPNGFDDVHRRLTEQENEIDYLRGQLEEARRSARASPFSGDFLSLKEQIVLKDGRISRLTEKLNDSNRQILPLKKSLRELANRMVRAQREVGRSLKREEKLQREIGSAQEELKALEQKATEEKQQAADMLRQEQEAHQQTRQRLESKIAEQQDQHAAAMKEAELKIRQELESKIAELQAPLKDAESLRLAQLRAAEEKHKVDLLKAEEKHKHDLEALKKKYTAQIAQLQEEKNGDIEAESAENWLEVELGKKVEA